LTDRRNLPRGIFALAQVPFLLSMSFLLTLTLFTLALFPLASSLLPFVFE
jgi:hypothetical protein